MISLDVLVLVSVKFTLEVNKRHSYRTVGRRQYIKSTKKCIEYLNSMFIKLVGVELLTEVHRTKSTTFMQRLHSLSYSYKRQDTKHKN